MLVGVGPSISVSVGKPFELGVVVADGCVNVGWGVFCGEGAYSWRKLQADNSNRMTIIER